MYPSDQRCCILAHHESQSSGKVRKGCGGNYSERVKVNNLSCGGGEEGAEWGTPASVNEA